MPLHFIQTVFIQSIETGTGLAHPDRYPPALREFIQAAANHLDVSGAIDWVSPPPHDTIQGILGIRMFDEMPQDGSDGLLDLTRCHLFRHTPSRLS